ARAGRTCWVQPQSRTRQGATLPHPCARDVPGRCILAPASGSRRAPSLMANPDSSTNHALPRLVDLETQVLDELGQGAGSRILLILDKKSGRKFALKVVRRQNSDHDIYIEQARTEFQAAQRLNHPTLLKIFDCRVKKAWFRVTGVELLMEYVDGRTLDEIDDPKIDFLILVFCRVSAGMAH